MRSSRASGPARRSTGPTRTRCRRCRPSTGRRAPGAGRVPRRPASGESSWMRQSQDAIVDVGAVIVASGYDHYQPVRGRVRLRAIGPRHHAPRAGTDARPRRSVGRAPAHRWASTADGRLHPLRRQPPDRRRGRARSERPAECATARASVAPRPCRRRTSFAGGIRRRRSSTCIATSGPTRRSRSRTTSRRRSAVSCSCASTDDDPPERRAGTDAATATRCGSASPTR